MIIQSDYPALSYGAMLWSRPVAMKTESFPICGDLHARQAVNKHEKDAATVQTTLFDCSVCSPKCPHTIPHEL